MELRTKRRVRLAMIAAAIMVLLAPTTANAAQGTTAIGQYSYSVLGNSYNFPKGALTYTIWGSGFRADQHQGKVEATQICYGKITLTERGVGDAYLRTTASSEYQGCLSGVQSLTRYNRTFPSDTRKACASFYLNGNYRNAACLDIY